MVLPYPERFRWKYVLIFIFILLLVNRKDLMGEHTNTVFFNIVAWVTAIFMIILTFVLVYQTILQAIRGTPT